jgi:hypothetical protein
MEIILIYVIWRSFNNIYMWDNTYCNIILILIMGMSWSYIVIDIYRRRLTTLPYQPFQRWGRPCTIYYLILFERVILMFNLEECVPMGKYIILILWIIPIGLKLAMLSRVSHHWSVVGSWAIGVRRVHENGIAPTFRRWWRLGG